EPPGPHVASPRRCGGGEPDRHLLRPVARGADRIDSSQAGGVLPVDRRCLEARHLCPPTRGDVHGVGASRAPASAGGCPQHRITARSGTDGESLLVRGSSLGRSGVVNVTRWPTKGTSAVPVPPSRTLASAALGALT